MQRLHLIELEDLPWFPRPIRDGGTDVLAAVGRGLVVDELGSPDADLESLYRYLID